MVNGGLSLSRRRPEVAGGYPLLVPSLLYLAGLVLAGKGRGVGASGIQSLGHP